MLSCQSAIGILKNRISYAYIFVEGVEFKKVINNHQYKISLQNKNK